MKTPLLLTVALLAGLSGCDAVNQAIAPQTAPTDPAELAASVRAGEDPYRKYCAECHGADARGSDKGPPLLHAFYKPGHHADVAFMLAVRQGTRQHHWDFGDMAPVEGISDAELKNVINWVRAEQRKAGLIP